MKLSDYIDLLQEIKDKHGNLEVCKSTREGYRQEAPPPEVTFKAILAGREFKPKFFNNFEADYYRQGEGRKGDMVVRV